MLREVVTIDEELCDGCGLCIPACHEGALRIVDGKARLVSDRLCDGLGACLGHCPRGAIRIEQREADAFDEAAVAAQQRAPHDGCPGSRLIHFAPETRDGESRAVADRPAQPSELTHWPVQLHLLSPAAPVLHNARLLVAADCVPVAYAGFHADFLRGRAVVIACPKLDDTSGYVEKLAAMIARSDLREITVVHMQVPCCTGILHAVLQARQLAGRDVPVEDVVIGIQGEIVSRRHVPYEPRARQVSQPACGRNAQQEGVA